MFSEKKIFYFSRREFDFHLLSLLTKKIFDKNKNIQR